MTEWRLRLETALEKNKGAAARFLQLGTVDENGRPAVRTVVFRGWRDGTNQLKIVTDGRSEKIGHLLLQPWVELCWYFEQTREQFRLAGSCTLVTPQTADDALQRQRQHAWRNLSDNARTQFLWPDPSQPRQTESFANTPPSPDQPLATFVLLLVQPEKVDHLRLRGEPQDRAFFVQQSSESWVETAVNP